MEQVHVIHLQPLQKMQQLNAKKIKIILPRDSPGLFHSYQTGLKWIKSETLAFDILYGNQPTFAGYNEDQSSLYRRTSTIQIGVRKAIDNFF